MELLSEFVTMLGAEGRRRVLDIGAGPGTDAAAFTAVGLDYVGVDLSPHNALSARGRGHLVVPASLFDLPFAASTFDAGWSLSTLMHVPVTEFHLAMRAIVDSLSPGSPLAIGLWGGDEREFVTDPNASGHRRLFSLRHAEHNQELLSAHGAIERFETWHAGPSDWEYQFAIVRVPERSLAVTQR